MTASPIRKQTTEYNQNIVLMISFTHHDMANLYGLYKNLDNETHEARAASKMMRHHPGSLQRRLLQNFTLVYVH
jgi:hypothetical protein